MTKILQVLLYLSYHIISYEKFLNYLLMFHIYNFSFSCHLSFFYLFFFFQRIELKEIFNNWMLMSGKHQPNKYKISLFYHNKIQEPYLTRYSVNKFYKVRKNKKKTKNSGFKCSNYF
jgi:hypothetical protein